MIDRAPLTIALSAVLVSATGKPVGRGAKPLNTAPPYTLLYPLTTALAGPPLADEHEDASFVYQVTHVSGPDPAKPNSYGSLDQVEWMADKTRKAILGRDPNTGLWLNTITVPGAKVTDRALDIEPGATNDPADAIISYVQRFRFDLTPA